MYQDKLLELSKSQALTSGGVTATNIVDLEVVRSISSGEPMSMFFTVKTAADLADADEFYIFSTGYYQNADQTTGNASVVGGRAFYATPTVGTEDAAVLVAGFNFSIPLPPVTKVEGYQFLGVYYTLGGTTPSITVDTWIAPTSFGDQLENYDNGYDIN